MTKTIQIPNLPIGTGAAIGSFVRNLYLTASSKYSIVAVNIDNKAMFDRIGANTVLVSDLLLMFATAEYEVNPAILTEKHKIGTTSLGDIYSAKVTGSFTDKIALSNFSSVFTSLKEFSIPLIEPVELTITFYICRVTGTVSDNLISASLLELNDSVASDDQLTYDEKFTLPIASNGRHKTNIWSTYESHKFTEDLTIHFEGPDEYMSGDVEHLNMLLGEYLSKLLDALQIG